MSRIAKYALILTLSLPYTVYSQNVVIVIIDGARYTESFGAGSMYLPHIWNQMRPLGTIWTNFRNNGITKTNPGHASILTGTWQNIDNMGTNRPTQPTAFEYFRKACGESEAATALAVGKNKLGILSHSTHDDYGIKYQAFTSIDTDDISTARSFTTILKQNHPKLALINLPGTDAGGHSGNWKQYISALHTADSLVYDIWETLQADSFYHDNTTFFITNDHGRHDSSHGDFENHGDECEGCRHIMLLAIGRGFSANYIIEKLRTQCDILPTAGKLLSFPTIFSIGTSLLQDTSAVQQ